MPLGWGCVIFVSGHSDISVDEGTLLKTFEHSGPVKEISIGPNQSRIRSAGPASARKAVKQLQDANLNGQTLRVSFAGGSATGCKICKPKDKETFCVVPLSSRTPQTPPPAPTHLSPVAVPAKKRPVPEDSDGTPQNDIADKETPRKRHRTSTGFLLDPVTELCRQGRARLNEDRVGKSDRSPATKSVKKTHNANGPVLVSATAVQEKAAAAAERVLAK